MPNRLQLSFVLSFVATFVALLLTSRFIGAQLRARGYDVNDLILIGLPKNQPPMTDNMSSPAELLAALKTDRNTQLIALLVGLVGSLVVYFKVFATTKRKPVLDPTTWKEFPLVEKITVSPNTAVYRFGLPHPNDVLGLPIGQHISVEAEINGKNIMRSYTPTSSDDDLGHFDLMVKTYEMGNISRYLSLLKIGDRIRVKGPKGQFRYSPSVAKEMGMIAGGTGITPMLQIIRAALKNRNDRTRLHLIYANVNVDDILLRAELDELAEKHAERFKVYYVLNNAPPNWKGGVGFVTKEQIQERLPPSNDHIKILMCGPPPMMSAMKKHLDELKYPAPRTVSKLVDQVFMF
ncbi:NADH-cytochrome b5 reductase [Rickenella mellea]|uniref:NADH-cytochrome b5 reductase n=1 Tax=Rickenella mellea TaxID=50990 RepID=A0A4Y7QP72_9AGAM|nr:NADH-cytochrome b5 reductase [Rickenella mellea]